MEAEEHNQQSPDAVRKVSKPPKNWKKVLLMTLVSLVLVAAGGAGGYYWRDKDAKSQAKISQAEATTLKEKLTKSEKDLAAAKKTTTTTTTTTTDTACVSPTASNLENIQASITSGNTAALEGYMASSVKVIIAASEGIGDRTPSQAVGDVAYLNPGGTNTWDFNLSAATITKYSSGDYKQYFPTGSLVGKAADKHVVSFQFDCKGKINGVFMAANDDLL